MNCKNANIQLNIYLTTTVEPTWNTQGYNTNSDKT